MCALMYMVKNSNNNHERCQKITTIILRIVSVLWVSNSLRFESMKLCVYLLRFERLFDYMTCLLNYWRIDHEYIHIFIYTYAYFNNVKTNFICIVEYSFFSFRFFSSRFNAIDAGIGLGFKIEFTFTNIHIDGNYFAYQNRRSWSRYTYTRLPNECNL